MDLSEISNLAPLGGASVLLVYLLRLISYERGRWIRERATLRDECAADLDRLVAEMDRRQAANDRLVGELRERIDDLKERNKDLHDSFAGLVAELKELKARGSDE